MGSKVVNDTLSSVENTVKFCMPRQLSRRNKKSKWIKTRICLVQSSSRIWPWHRRNHSPVNRWITVLQVAAVLWNSFIFGFCFANYCANNRTVYFGGTSFQNRVITSLIRVEKNYIIIICYYLNKRTVVLKIAEKEMARKSVTYLFPKSTVCLERMGNKEEENDRQVRIREWKKDVIKIERKKNSVGNFRFLSADNNDPLCLQVMTL